MERSGGSVTLVDEGCSIENTLFTYSEEEMEEHRVNKANAKLVLNPLFIPVYTSMLQNFSLIETVVYGFVSFFLSSNERFYITNEQIAQMLNTSEKTVSLAVKALKEKGLITTSYKTRKGGGKIRFIEKVDFTKCNVATLQNVMSIDVTKSNDIYNNIIYNNINISKSKDLEQRDYSELFNTYYGKSKGIDVKVCTKLIDTKLSEGYTLEEIKRALILYNCECRTKGSNSYRYVKKFETWIKEFQPITDENIGVVIAQHRERMEGDSKYGNGVGKTVYNDLVETFGADKIKELWKATNKSIGLRFI